VVALLAVAVLRPLRRRVIGAARPELSAALR